MGRAMLSKSLIQFSVGGLGCVPSLLFDLRPTSGGSNEDNSNLLQKDLCPHCCIQCPDPAAGHCQPTPPPETPGHSKASLAQSLVWTLLLSPGSWCTRFYLPQSHLKRITLKILLFSLGRKKTGSLIVPYPTLAFKNTTFTFNPFAYVLLFPWYRCGTESLKC